MSFLQQIAELLSEAPGSIIYHLITLLTVQAVLAMAWAQWRRERSDRLAWRLLIGAGLIVFTRLAFLLAILISGFTNQAAVQVLPPLEQALNTVTLLLIIWSLTPPPDWAPRLFDVLLTIAFVGLGVVYVFFAQNWYMQGAGISYPASSQALVWSAIQVGLIGGGLLLQPLTGRGQRDWPLYSLTFILLLSFHLAQLFNFPGNIVLNTEVPYWSRLGQLVAIPLLAIITYRHTIFSLLNRKPPAPTVGQPLAQALEITQDVIQSLDVNRTVNEALLMIDRVVVAEFVAIALLSTNDDNQVRVVSLRSNASGPRYHNWELNLSDWPSFRLALKQQHSIELVRNGLGARQLMDLYRELDLGDLGPLLLEPMIINKREIGLLLMAAPIAQERWSAQAAALTPRLARYIGQAINNTQQHDKLLRERSSLPTTSRDTAAIGRLIMLEKERDIATAKIESLSNRLRSTEEQVHIERQRNEEMNERLVRFSQDESVLDENTQTTLNNLEAEVHALRESLFQAEEALATVAAGDRGLSTEWVMRTISRYSGELEEAQALIKKLEYQVRERDAVAIHQDIIALLQELRSPLTAMAGYTDILLGETLGILGRRQKDFVQRIQSGARRMHAVLDQLSQLIVQEEAAAQSASTADLREAVETSVGDVAKAMQQKQLRLNVDIAPGIPAIPMEKETLQKVLINVLNYACNRATPASTMNLAAAANTIQDVDATQPETVRFLQLTIRGPQRNGTQSHHNGNGNRDPGGYLATVNTLVQAHGGRTWQDNPGSDHEGRFSVILPLETTIRTDLAE